MEIANVVEVPSTPVVNMMGSVEPADNDKQIENQTEVTFIVQSIKSLEPESVPQVPVEENRPAEAFVVPNNGTETLVTFDSHLSGQSSGASEVVTPAGTVETPYLTPDSPKTGAADNNCTILETKEPIELEVENDSGKVVDNIDETITSHIVGNDTADIVEHTVDPTTEAHDDSKPIPVSPSEDKRVATLPATSTEEPAQEVVSASSSEKNTKNEANNNSCARDEILVEVKKFIMLQIVENRCSSHSKEIHEFVEEHLNKKQRERHVPTLIECVVQHLTREATTKGEELSMDVQSNICLIEQMFLTLGRRSPLQDMYSEEEEQMLDLLFHSNSTDDLQI